jgi:release factor glutamine methyltransferase
MKISSLIHQGINALQNSSDTPRLDAEYMLMALLNLKRVDLIVDSNREVDQKTINTFHQMIEARQAGKPLSYIIGTEEFMGLTFEVNENVLIPRDDTEVLVEKIIELYKAKDDLNILDIGTGSGAIAIALAAYLNVNQVIAVDKYQEALKVAQQNAKNNKVFNKMQLIQSDLFDALDEYKDYFDIIVSNPPYIPKNDILDLQVEIKEHEPMTALDGGADGLTFYRQIVQQAGEFLKAKGLLAFEIGYDQGEDVKQLMTQGFQNIQVIKDLSGLDRVVLGFKK